MKTEPHKSDLGLTTRFECRLTRNLAGAEELVPDTIGECRAQEAKVNR
jgi:hypothetical protein